MASGKAMRSRCRMRLNKRSIRKRCRLVCECTILAWAWPQRGNADLFAEDEQLRATRHKHTVGPRRQLRSRTNPNSVSAQDQWFHSGPCPAPVHHILDWNPESVRNICHSATRHSLLRRGRTSRVLGEAESVCCVLRQALCPPDCKSTIVRKRMQEIKGILM